MPDSTLLSYDFAPMPDPPFQTGSGVMLAFEASNNSGAPVTCTAILVSIPYGGGETDLIATDPVQADPPDGWSPRIFPAGLVSFDPPGGSVELQPGDGLKFDVILEVNGAAGTAQVTLGETASNAGSPSMTRQVLYPVAKFGESAPAPPPPPPPAPLPAILSYGLSLTPDPLQIGAGATLQLAVSNRTPLPVTCSQIIVTYPTGSNAKDLAPGDAAVTVTPEPGWSYTGAAGNFVFTPPGDIIIDKGQGLLFTLATATNDQVGPTGLTVTETTSTHGIPKDQRCHAFTFTKFPPAFALSEPQTVPPGQTQVASGQTIQLSWCATGPEVSCTLGYQPADDGDPISQSVPNDTTAAPFTSVPLTRSGAVSFQLTAAMTVAGQDEPLTVTRELVIAVETLAIETYAEPLNVAMNGLARFRWETKNAAYCTLQDGSRLPANGAIYFVMRSAESVSFSISAVGEDATILPGFERTFELDTSVVATEPGYSVTGDTGGNGADAQSIILHNSEGFPLRRFVGPASPGNAGADGVFAQQLPPFDVNTKPRRVIPISVTGGTGGQGGAGGGNFGPGAGGDGGNAILDIQGFGLTGDPAQFIIVNVTGGAGGVGGDIGEYGNGPPAAAGKSGTVSAMVMGQPLPLS